MMVSKSYRFGGFNIKGTPRMSAKRVSHDIGVVKERCDVAFLSEYKWDYYWGVLRHRIVHRGEQTWGTFPGLVRGFAAPVFGAQVVLWDKDKFRFKKGHRRLLHRGRRRISESRQLRGAWLEEELTGLDCWFAGTHYVVKGDERSDPDIRNKMMQTDIRHTAEFLDDLIRTGAPIVFQLDANIHPGTWAYAEFRNMIKQRNGRIIGEHGIEFLIVFDRHSKTKVIVEHPFRVSKEALETDHEGRGIVFRLHRMGSQ